MTKEQIVSIVEALDMQSNFIEYLVDLDESIEDSFTDWYNTALISEFDTEQEKVFALMEQDNFTYDEAENKIDGQYYLVMDDDEANEAWEEYLDNYIDDCILPELPELAQRYFDRDTWISDARYDGRGHALSAYDGNELDQTINNTTYYIYKM